MGDDDENWMAGMGMGNDDDEESIRHNASWRTSVATGADLDACVKVLTALSSDLEAFRADVTLKPLRKCMIHFWMMCVAASLTVRTQTCERARYNKKQANLRRAAHEPGPRPHQFHKAARVALQTLNALCDGNDHSLACPMARQKMRI